MMDTAAYLRESLLDKLRARVWRAGHRIPTERSLSLEYSLGRSTVRRVLAELKRKHLITQRVGSGTYVADQVHEALAALTPAGLQATAAQTALISPAWAISPAELMNARLVLEPALIEMVVGNATAADFARMDECNAQAEQAQTLEEFERWDTALHEAIADAAHNGFISSTFRLMGQVRSQGEWGVLKRRSATPERRLAYQQEHRELVAAIQQRDVEQARALCLAHLLRVRVNMLGH